MMPLTIRMCVGVCVLIFAGACSAPVNVEDRQQGQVFICHNGSKTLAVSTADFHRHREHGDSAGPCPEETD